MNNIINILRLKDKQDQILFLVAGLVVMVAIRVMFYHVDLKFLLEMLKILNKHSVARVKSSV